MSAKWNDYIRDNGGSEYATYDNYQKAKIAQGHKPDCDEVVYCAVCSCGRSNPFLQSNS